MLLWFGLSKSVAQRAQNFQIIQKIAHPWLSAKKIVGTNSNRQVDLNLTGEKELFEAEVRGHVKEA